MAATRNHSVGERPFSLASQAVMGATMMTSTISSQKIGGTTQRIAGDCAAGLLARGILIRHARHRDSGAAAQRMHRYLLTGVL
jgi:hypothetical protein